MIVIPTFQDRSSRYEFDIELAGDIWHLLFSWNAREEVWYMDIQDQDQNNILLGIKIVPNYLLLDQYKSYALPAGEFICWDLKQTPETGTLDFDTFGKRYQLLFFSDEEL